MNPSDMTMRLALVLCGPALEAGLTGAGIAGVSLIRLTGTRPRSSLLMAAVDLLVEDAGVERESIREVLVSRGPGSFTGIRSGLAAALGLRAALGARVLAYDSLLMQAGRISTPGPVQTAQPGRRDEFYTQSYEIDQRGYPHARGDIEIRAIGDLAKEGPWLAADTLELGAVERAVPERSSAESLLRLPLLGIPSSEPEAFYLEGPPISVPRNG